MEIIPCCAFKSQSDKVLVLGKTLPEFEGSEYGMSCHRRRRGSVPELDFDFHLKICSLLRELVAEGLLTSSMHVARGGLAAAISTSCLSPSRPIGAQLTLELDSEKEEYRADMILFRESASRYLISCAADKEEQILQRCKDLGIPVTGRGEVGGHQIKLIGAARARISLATAYKVWSQSLRQELDV